MRSKNNSITQNNDRAFYSVRTEYTKTLNLSRNRRTVLEFQQTEIASDDMGDLLVIADAIYLWIQFDVLSAPNAHISIKHVGVRLTNLI